MISPGYVPRELKSSVVHVPRETYGAPVYPDVHQPWGSREAFREGEELTNAQAGRLELFHPLDYTADYIRPDAAGMVAPNSNAFRANGETDNSTPPANGETPPVTTTTANPLTAALTMPTIPNIDWKNLVIAGVGIAVLAAIVYEVAKRV